MAARAWSTTTPRPSTNNIAVRDAIANGEIDVGLINHYYVAEAIAEEEGEDYPVGVLSPADARPRLARSTSRGSAILEGGDKQAEAPSSSSSCSQRRAQELLRRRDEGVPARAPESARSRGDPARSTSSSRTSTWAISTTSREPLSCCSERGRCRGHGLSGRARGRGPGARRGPAPARRAARRGPRARGRDAAAARLPADRGRQGGGGRPRRRLDPSGRSSSLARSVGLAAAVTAAAVAISVPLAWLDCQDRPPRTAGRGRCCARCRSSSRATSARTPSSPRSARRGLLRARLTTARRRAAAVDQRLRRARGSC